MKTIVGQVDNSSEWTFTPIIIPSHAATMSARKVIYQDSENAYIHLHMNADANANKNPRWKPGLPILLSTGHVTSNPILREKGNQSIKV